MSNVDVPDDADAGAIGDAARLAALRQTALLDTPPEETFDRLTRLAAHALAAPVALVTLVDRDRQFIKSAFGLPKPWACVRETPLSHSLCSRVVARGAALVVGDARRDPVLASGGAVRDLGVVAYLGVPLRTATGQTLGAVCAIDMVPRAWTERDVAALHDLAALATTELERRRAEANVRAFAEHAPYGMYRTTPNGTLLTANPAMARLLGYDSPAELCGLDVARQVYANPADREWLLARVLRHGFDAPVDLAWRRKDGTAITVRLGGRPVFGPDGAVTYWEGFAEDVTALRAAEAALRRSQARLVDAEELAQIGHWEWDVATEAVIWSDGLYRLMGVRQGDAPPSRHAFLERVHPADREAVATGIEAAVVAGAEFEFDARVLRPDGTSVTVHGRVQAVADGGQPVRILGVVRDVTERTRAAEALQEAHELLWAFISAAPAAVVGRDQAGVVTLWNPAAERIFGWRAVEVLGSRLPEALADLLPDLETIDGMTVPGEVVAGIEATRRRKDGTAVDVSVSSALLRDAAGCATGTMAVVADVTARRQLEARVRGTERLEALGRLAAGVAHDFNNYLNVIAMGAGILAHGASDAQRADVLSIQRAVDGAEALTRQLLDFSRRRETAPEVLDVNTRVAGLEALLRRLAGADVRLVTAAGARPAWVRADPGQLDQVLVNLVVNARDAMPNGGTLTIAVATTPQGTVQISVRDTGCGMDEATRARVFEPFFTTKPEGQGTGLGLATVYGIVTQAGGIIAVESAPGAGTAFTLDFPGADAPAAATR